MKTRILVITIIVAMVAAGFAIGAKNDAKKASTTEVKSGLPFTVFANAFPNDDDDIKLEEEAGEYCKLAVTDAPKSKPD